MNTDPTKRFSLLVSNYLLYRPSYPAAAVEWLRDRAGFSPDCVIADIGCGTGLFARLLLERGCSVFGIEPNPEMRAAAQELLAGEEKFVAVAGRAESSGLPSASVDGVTAAQAFHWFEVEAARQEFSRILRPGGWVALIWNRRLTVETPFLREYEELLMRYGTDYTEVNHRNIDDTKLAVFFPGGYEGAAFANRQDFDYPGLRGRLLSSSYVPQDGHPNFTPMLRELLRVFERHQKNGTVHFLYETEIYWGHL